MSLPAIDLTFLLSASSQQNSRGLQNPKSWHVEIGTSSTALAFLLTSTNSLVCRILLVCVVCALDIVGKHHHFVLISSVCPSSEFFIIHHNRAFVHFSLWVTMLLMSVLRQLANRGSYYYSEFVCISVTYHYGPVKIEFQGEIDNSYSTSS